MNKQLKGILAGCGVLAVLGGGLAAVLLTDPGDGDESSVVTGTEQTPLWGYDSAAVSKIRVEQPGREAYTANRKMEQVQSSDMNGQATTEEVANYYLEGYESLPMSTVSIRLLTTRATDVHAEQVVSENASAEELAKYGLDDPIMVTLTVDGQDDISFLIGDKTPVSTYTYLSMAGSNAVYTVSSSVTEPYLTELNGYLGTDLTAEQAADDERLIKSTRIERKDLDYDMYFVFDPYYEENTNSGSAAVHVMQEPIQALLNAEKSPDATHGLFGLKASAVLTPFPKEADMKAAGLDDPSVRVTTELSDGTKMMLRLGNTYTDDDGNTMYYGYYDGIDCIYGFSPDDTVYENVMPEDLVSRIIVDMYVWDVGTVNYKAGSKTLNFTAIATDQTDAVVKLNGEAYENVERYRQMYSYLLKAAAEDLILEEPDDVGAEMASVYVAAKGDKRSYDIKFYEAGGMKAYIEIDGQIRFRCRKSYVTTLIDNINKFDDESQEFTMSW